MRPQITVIQFNHAGSLFPPKAFKTNSRHDVNEIYVYGGTGNKVRWGPFRASAAATLSHVSATITGERTPWTRKQALSADSSLNLANLSCEPLWVKFTPQGCNTPAVVFK